MVTSIKGNDTSTFGGNIDVTGNVVTDAPAFSAYASGAQSVSTSTYNKVSYSAEEFDTASCYDTSLSRFTPNVEGYYQVSANIVFEGVGAGAETFSILYKNGATWNWGTNFDFKSGHYYGHTITSLIYLNGTTDYIEIYFNQSSGSSVNINPSGSFPSRFGAFLARAV